MNIDYEVIDESSAMPPGIWRYVDLAKPGSGRTVLITGRYYGKTFYWDQLLKFLKEKHSMKDWNDKGQMTIRERFVASALRGVLADATTIGGSEICRDLDAGEIVDKAFAVTNIALARLGYGEPANPQLEAYTAAQSRVANEQAVHEAKATNEVKRGHFAFKCVDESAMYTPPSAAEHVVRITKETKASHGLSGSHAEVRFHTALSDFNRRREYRFLTRVRIPFLPAGTHLDLPRGESVTIDHVCPYVPPKSLLVSGNYARQLTRNVRQNVLPPGTRVLLPDTRHLFIEVELTGG